MRIDAKQAVYLLNANEVNYLVTYIHENGEFKRIIGYEHGDALSIQTVEKIGDIIDAGLALSKLLL